MNSNYSTIQGVLSIGALICLIIGWFGLLSPELNDLIYHKIFYVLIGLSFFFSAQTYPNPTHKYIAYAAAALCIIGAFLPENLAFLKTIGLLAGVALTFIARPRPVR